MNDKSNIAFIDLQAQQNRIRKEIAVAINKVLEHGNYIMGPEIASFENDLSQFCGAKHSISCASGTDALLLALLAIGLKPGDAVIVPSFTFVSTAEVVAVLGAIPVFVDIDEDYFLLDISSLKEAIQKAKKEGLDVKCVIPVDLFGQPADYDAINAIAAENDLHVIADAAQSFGGKQGSNFVGTLAEITTTSFFPAKPLGCYGDGGAVFTNNDELASKIKSLRVHGKGTDKYDNINIGINGRLDTIQAAILIEKLKIFPAELANRDKIANRYSTQLSECVNTPKIMENNFSAWAQYTLKIENRDEIMAKLKVLGIPCAVYYPRPLHQQTAYMHYPKVNETLSVSEKLSGMVMSVPMHPYLEDIYQDRIIDAIKNCI